MKSLFVCRAAVLENLLSPDIDTNFLADKDSTFMDIKHQDCNKRVCVVC